MIKAMEYLPKDNGIKNGKNRLVKAILINYLKLALQTAVGWIIHTAESFQHFLHPTSICSFSGPYSNHFLFSLDFQQWTNTPFQISNNFY